MPAPYPAAWERSTIWRNETVSRSTACQLNLMVLALDWIFWDRPVALPGDCPVGPLSRAQWQTVGRLADLSIAWSNSARTTCPDLGRAASTFEDISSTIRELERFALRSTLLLGLGIFPDKLDWDDEPLPGRPPADRGTRVVGSMRGRPPEVARELNPDRLRFHGRPSFDPRPHLPPDVRAAYEDPRTLELPGAPPEPPVVRVRASRRRTLDLYRLLASSGRLVVVPAESVRPDDQVGAFAVYKDEARDRMIVDARPPNRRLKTLGRWTRTLAMAASLLNVSLEPGQVLALYSDDLTDYYHTFVVSREQTMKNIFRGRWSAGEMRRALGRHARGPLSGSVCAGLRTLAMGNTNSVEFGQAAHVSLAAQTGALTDADILRLHCAPPRTDYMGGIMIDDHVGLEKEPAAGYDDVARA